MIQQESIFSEQQVLEATVARAREDQDRVAGEAASYDNAAVSVSIAVGPQGGGMQGWITYLHNQQKIYFSASNVESYGGLFAGGGALPIIGTLAAGRLAGKTGTFEASGGVFGGSIQMWVDGLPVFVNPIPISPGLPWHIKGQVTFGQPVE